MLGGQTVFVCPRGFVAGPEHVGNELPTLQLIQPQLARMPSLFQIAVVGPAWFMV